MVHLRLVVPAALLAAVLEALGACRSVINIVNLPGAARRPDGHLVLCDVAREDASVVIADLRDLCVHQDGSIAVMDIETSVSVAADRAAKAAAGAAADAVIWEDVAAKTSESSELSGAFAIFTVLATLIASVGIFLDSPILVVGAMVVGPEFGAIAGFCVAVIERRGGLARTSGLALAAGFPLGIAAAAVAALAFRALGVIPAGFHAGGHGLSAQIASPSFFAFFVAFCAGVAGMLSLTTAKSGALIGVFISVTTIPAAANTGVALAGGDWHAFRGSLVQLVINIASLLVAGVLTLLVQRGLFHRRRRDHERSRARMQPGKAAA